MKRFFRTIIAAISLALPMTACAQTTVLQGGPWTPGHLAQYLGTGSQPYAVDAGGAAGGSLGALGSELGLMPISPTRTYPNTTPGGPGYTNFCTYDAPTTNATGYHYLCLGPNANGSGGLLNYGSGGGATPLPLYFNINGVTSVPGGVSNLVQPGSTTVVGGSSYGLLYNNNGVLGTEAPDMLEFTNYGADPTGVANSDTAFSNWLAAMKATNNPGHAAAGNYKFANQVFIDVSGNTGQGVKIYGDGCNATRFTYSGASAPAFRLGNDFSGPVSAVSTYGLAASGGTGYASGGTATYYNVPLTGGTGSGAQGVVAVVSGVVAGIAITASGTGYTVGDNLSASNAYLGGTGSGLIALVRGDNFYSMIKGIGFIGSVNGPLVQYGRNDMLDAINGLETDVCENNNSTGSLAEGVRINSVVTSPYLANTTGGLGETNGHSACEVRGAAMVNFYGSCSGMAIGTHVTATSAQSVYGNIFHAIDSEVNGKNIVIDNSGGGSPPLKNTWIGGQFAYSTCAIDASAGSNNIIINGNLGGVNDFCNTTGIQTIGASYSQFTNSTWATLGLTPTNGIATWPNVTGSVNAGVNFLNNSNQFTIYETSSGAGSVGITAAGQPIIFTASATGYHQFYIGSTLEGYFSSLGFTANALFVTNNTNINGTLAVGGAGSITGTLSAGALSIVNNANVNGVLTSATSNATTSGITNLTAQTYKLNNMLATVTSPTISSGFGTGALIAAINGTATFNVYVGTSGIGSVGTVGLPAANSGWNCFANNFNTSPASFITKQTGYTTTSATFTNFNTSGATAAWVVGDVLHISCTAY